MDKMDLNKLKKITKKLLLKLKKYIYNYFK